MATVVSLSEAAQRAAVVPAKLFALVSRGEIAGQRVGSSWQVELQSLEAYLAKRRSVECSPRPAA